MGNIRKQTILSSILIYIGFFIGFVNSYISTKTGSFTPEQYGLTRIFADFAQNMYAFGALGIIPVIYKFYPYYKDNLETDQIDLVTWAMVVALIGFILVSICGFYFEPVIVAGFSERSKLVVDYYYWMFPLAMGLLFFSVLESVSWALHKTVLPSFLRETAFRALSAIIIFLFYFKMISFPVFIKLFSFQYLVIFLVLFIYLYQSRQFHFTFTVSRVTKKFWKKMLTMQALTFSGTCIAAIAATVDSFIIAHFKGLQWVGIFMFAQYAASFVQVPMRSIQAAAVGVLSIAWKQKDYKEINRIYKRSCINLLLMALFIFGNLWLNITDTIQVLGIQKAYTDGLGVMFVLGMIRIIDAGTGLNAAVINTSTFWRFDCMSGVVLFILRLPLTYFLIKQYGIIGSAVAELISYSVYNFIRFEFLRRRFSMQPFDVKTILALLLGIAAYFICFYSFRGINGWTAIILRGILFSFIMIAGIFYWKLTPDALQLWDKAKRSIAKK